jgi:hypothetical protein
MDTPVCGPWTIKREYPRYLIDIRLIVRTTQVLHGRTKNLSEGGLGATIAGDMQLGSVVRLEFMLPEVSEPLSLHAEVRYRQGFQFGFKFINQTDRQREIIRRATRALQLDVTSR